MKNLFAIVFIAIMLVSCSSVFKEKNELAIPPFFKEEYRELQQQKSKK